MEVSSGQGSKEVKTALYLSDKPLVDHISFDLGEVTSCFFSLAVLVLCLVVELIEKNMTF